MQINHAHRVALGLPVRSKNWAESKTLMNAAFANRRWHRSRPMYLPQSLLRRNNLARLTSTTAQSARRTLTGMEGTRVARESMSPKLRAFGNSGELHRRTFGIANRRPRTRRKGAAAKVNFAALASTSAAKGKDEFIKSMANQGRPPAGFKVAMAS